MVVVVVGAGVVLVVVVASGVVVRVQHMTQTTQPNRVSSPTISTTASSTSGA